METKKIHLIFSVKGKFSDNAAKEISNLIMQKMLETSSIDYTEEKDSPILSIILDCGRTVREIQEGFGLAENRRIKDDIYEHRNGYYLYNLADIEETLKINLPENPNQKENISKPIRELSEYQANEVIRTHLAYIKDDIFIGHRENDCIYAGLEYRIVEYMMDSGHIGWKFFTWGAEYVGAVRKDLFFDKNNDCVTILKTTYPK